MLWIILLALSATVDSWAVGMAYKDQDPAAGEGDDLAGVRNDGADSGAFWQTAFGDPADRGDSGIRRNAAGGHGRESVVADKKRRRKDQL